MKSFIPALVRAALASAVLGFAANAQRANRDPVVALDDGRAERPRQRSRQGLQREPEAVQGRPGLQGRVSRVDGGGDRRVPRRQRAAHPAGVRGRHRDDDGRQGRHQAGRRGDARGGREVRSQVVHQLGRRLLHHDQGRDAVVPVQQLDAGVLLQQGRVREGGPRSRTARRRPGRRSWRRRPRSRRRARRSARTPPAGRRGCTSRTSRRGTTCRSAPRKTAWPGLDTVFEINTPLHVKHWSNLKDWNSKGYFTYAGRRNEAEAKFYSGECAMLTSSSAAQANINRNAKFKYGVGDDAVLRRRRRRAAELDHRRRVAVGDVGQEGRRVQGRRQVHDLPRRPAAPGARGTSRPATCRSRRSRTTSPRAPASTRRTRAPTSRCGR